MENFILYLLKSVGVLFLFYTVYQIFLKRETFFLGNRIFLALGLVAAIGLPLLVFTKIIFVEPMVQTTASSSSIVVNTDTSNWSWEEVLFAIYSIGVLFFAFRLGIQFFSLIRTVRESNVEKKNGFYHVINSKVTAPFSFFNYIVYNPECCEEKELKFILKHEKVHAQQWHSIDVLVMHIFTVFQWCNPVVWLYRKTLVQNLEYLADKTTVSKLKSFREYQYALLKVSAGAPNLSITNQFFNSLIKKRIVMLHQNQSSKLKLWKYSTILPLLILFLINFNTKVVAQEVVEEVVTTVEEDGDDKIRFTATYIYEGLGTITKGMSDTDLNQLKKDMLTSHGYELSYNNIKRNDKGEIYAIDIKLETENSFVNGSYSGSSDEPIGLIRFGESKKGGLFIKMDDNEETSNTVRVYRTELDQKIKKKKKNSKIKIKEKDDGALDKIKTIEIIESDGKNEIIVDGKKATKKELKEKGIVIEENNEEDDIDIGDTIHISSNNKDGTQPLFIVDGKKWSYKKVKKLNPDDIDSINVLKGKKAEKKYGKASKNGVVEINTNKD